MLFIGLYTIQIIMSCENDQIIWFSIYDKDFDVNGEIRRVRYRVLIKS